MAEKDRETKISEVWDWFHRHGLKLEMMLNAQWVCTFISQGRYISEAFGPDAYGAIITAMDVEAERRAERQAASKKRRGK